MVNDLMGILFCLGLLYPLSGSAQLWEYSVPKPMPFNVNSDGEEAMPLLSPDGKLLFFSRSVFDLNIGGKFSGHDIWVSERTASGWTRASNSYFNFNTKGNEAIIGTNRAGNGVYFMRTFPNKKISGIYYASRAKGQWGAPQFIPIEGLESQGSLGFYMHPEEDVLLISMKRSDSLGEEDIYISLKSDKNEWSAPKNLGTAINTERSEISPFLSADKRSLYFASTGHAGLGDADIFVAYRLYDSWETWSVAQNLGDKVNSKNFDAYYSVYGDSVAYLTSNRDGRQTDIYSVVITPTDPERQVIPLQDEEVASLIGENISCKVEFGDRSTSLSANQRELLWYIATRLISRKDVRIMLVPSDEDDSEISGSRLNSIIAQLAGAGIEGSRIRREDHDSAQEFAMYAPPKGEVHLVLVR